jgi:hypothetical protein
MKYSSLYGGSHNSDQPAVLIVAHIAAKSDRTTRTVSRAKPSRPPA